MREEEIRVVFDAYIFKGGILRKEPYSGAYGKMLQNRNHALIISDEILEKYSDAIAKNGFSPKVVIGLEYQQLIAMQKLRFAREEKIEKAEVKVHVPDKDKAFTKAAFALKAKYIVTQDRRHFLSKKEEFKKHQIDVLTPEEYTQIC